MERTNSRVSEPRVEREEQGIVLDPLTSYLDEMKAHRVPTAQEERDFAKAIEQLEIAHWQVLLSFAPALPVIRAALKPHLREPKELVALRKVGAGTRAGEQQRRKQAVARAAERLRQRDATRVALAAVHTAVFEAFTGADPHASNSGSRAEPRASSGSRAEPRASTRESSAARAYLQRAEKAKLAQQAMKNRFMQANLRLVVSLARRYNQKLLPLGDLIQEGNLGLMRAVERFDYKKGFRFSTYASWWIRHGFNRALSDRGRLVRVPVHLLDDAQRVAKARSALMAAHGRPPTMSELAEKASLSEEKLELILSHATARTPASLDTPLSGDGDSTLLDVLAAPEDAPLEARLDAERWSDGVGRLLAALSPIEASIVRLRFGLDHDQELTLAEIGERYNLSRERIRQLQVQALQKLRAQIEQRDAA